MSQLVDNYYLSLGEVMFAFGFLVGIKVGLGYVMNAIMKVLRDDPTPTSDQVETPAIVADDPGQRSIALGRRTLFIGLATAWTFSALIQILPMMVIVSKHQYLSHATEFDPIWLVQFSTWFSGVWFWDSTAANIISILIQISIALIVYLGRKHFVGKIGVWLSLIFALLQWIFGGGVNHLFAAPHMVAVNFPGSALLVVVISALLLLPTTYWEQARFTMWLTRAVTGFYLLAALWQITAFVRMPMTAMASTLGVQHDAFALILVTGQDLFRQEITTYGAWIIAGLALIWLYAAVVSIRWVQSRVSMILVILLFLIEWWFVEGFGCAPHYLLNVGMMPLLMFLMWSLHLMNHTANIHK